VTLACDFTSLLNFGPLGTRILHPCCSLTFVSWVRRAFKPLSKKFVFFNCLGAHSEFMNLCRELYMDKYSFAKIKQELANFVNKKVCPISTIAAMALSKLLLYQASHHRRAKA